MSDTSYISAGQRVVGTVSAAEDLVIVGRVEGRIQSEATVTIEAQAIVEADILARHVVVRGIVIGEIAGVDGIEIAPTGQVLGDLKTRRLALRAGGRVAGLVHTGIEVPPYAYGGKTTTATRARVQAPTGSLGSSMASSPSPSPRSAWPTTSEEVVESSGSRSSGNPHEARKAKKEPSREAI
ncbi:MAG: polymer-forming cytoskeletal protein [Myxococcota bacterium]